MQEAVHNVFGVMKGAEHEPDIPPMIERAIAASAELIARGRTAVKREHNDDIDYVPEAEGATRLAQQFCQLTKGSARLNLPSSVPSIPWATH